MPNPRSQLPLLNIRKTLFHRKRLLQSPLDPLDQHIQVAQHWRMVRCAPFHVRLRLFRRHFLLQCRIGLVSCTNEVS